jgi:hypothetical protein
MNFIGVPFRTCFEVHRPKSSERQTQEEQKRTISCGTSRKTRFPEELLAKQRWFLSRSARNREVLKHRRTRASVENGTVRIAPDRGIRVLWRNSQSRILEEVSWPGSARLSDQRVGPKPAEVEGRKASLFPVHGSSRCSRGYSTVVRPTPVIPSPPRIRRCQHRERAQPLECYLPSCMS